MRTKLYQAKCNATAARRFSTFFEKAFVSLVKRRMLMRIVRFCRSTTWTRRQFRFCILSSRSFEHPSPICTIKRIIVSRCVSVIRSVERIELPSMRQLIIWVWRPSDKRFISVRPYLSLWPQKVHKSSTILDLCPQTVYIPNMKTEVMKLRVSETEKRAFQKGADLAGVALSAWVRERLRLAARRELVEAGEQVPFLQERSLYNG